MSKELVVSRQTLHSSDVEATRSPPGTSTFVLNHGDPKHPQNWSAIYKWTIVVLISFQALVVNIAIPIIAPAAPQISASLNADSGALSNLDETFMLSVWGLGQMSGPLLFSPLSERYGRAPLYHTTTILFIVFSIGGALSSSISMVIAFRFLMGFVTIAYTINPTIVGDLFTRERRGRAMSIVFIAPMSGTLIGPISGGFLTQSLGWRWVFWLPAVLAGLSEVGMIAIYRETYYPRLLYRRVRRGTETTIAAQLSDQTRHCSLPESIGPATMSPISTPSTVDRVALSVTRPLTMLFTSTVVLLVSIYVAVVLGYVYLLVSTMTPIFEASYGIKEGPVGLVFLGIGIGQLIGVLFCGMVMDRYHQQKVQTHNGVSEPEFRLMPMIVAGVLMPVGLFWYGWSVEKHCPIWVPVVGTGFFAVGVAVCQIVSSSYLVDAFGDFSASAMAASMSLRFLSSALLPLIAPPMYGHLGLGWGNSLLGLVALLLVPAPGLLIRYGKKLRSKGRFSTSRCSGNLCNELE